MSDELGGEVEQVVRKMTESERRRLVAMELMGPNYAAGGHEGYSPLICTGLAYRTANPRGGNWHRLTPLGLAVKQHLESNDG